LLERAYSARLDLRRKRHREFSATRLRRDIEVLTLLALMQFIDLALNTLGFLALLPHIEPLLSVLVLASVDDLQHVLRWILIFTALASAVCFEVFQESVRVLAEFAEVNSLATTGEEEKTVEFLEQDGGRLVDGAEDGLASGTEFTEEGDDGPRALRRS
jgi:hypothetical protein